MELMNISLKANVKTLYPLKFKPVFIEKVWAGRLCENVPEKTGEVWSIVDRLEHQSIISEGPQSGKTLSRLIRENPEGVLGKGREAKQFPIMVKLINAGEKLSVQVHPGKDGPKGSESKSEMWYILNKEDDARVYLGFKKDFTAKEIQSSLKSDSIVNLLNVYSSCVGDSYFIPAGTVHALGAGNLVLEIQQNSDSTYRLYDWGRRDSKGEFRKLHKSEGLKSIRPARYKKGINWEIEQPSFSLKEIIDTDWSTVFEVSGDYVLNCREESCFTVSAVEVCFIQYEQFEIKLAIGESALIPAALERVNIKGEKWLLTKVK